MYPSARRYALRQSVSNHVPPATTTRPDRTRPRCRCFSPPRRQSDSPVGSTEEEDFVSAPSIPLPHAPHAALRRYVARAAHREIASSNQHHHLHHCHHHRHHHHHHPGPRPPTEPLIFYSSLTTDAYETTTYSCSCRALLIIVLVGPNFYSAGPRPPTS